MTRPAQQLQPAAMPVAAAPATAEAPEQFVINLCASTTPMALVQPKNDELKRFTFFVSRRREDGRERFRLHMGYFASAEDAEQWLAVVRDVYPAAWVGVAPGRKLRAAAAAKEAEAAREESAPRVTAAVQMPQAPAHEPEPAPAPDAEVAQARPSMPPLSAPPDLSPVERAAAEALAQKRAAAAERAAAARAQLERAAAEREAAHRAAVERAVAERAAAERAAAERAAAERAAASARRSAPAKPTTPARKSTGAPPVVPTLRPAAAPAASKPAARAPAAPPPPAKPAAPAASNLSDSQVLRVLEERRMAAEPAPERRTEAQIAADAAISVLSPDDTRTLRTLSAEIQRNAPVQFAVQLDWSVSSIDIGKVPPLAIFGAYTLYTVESQREGRKWYGLRLGFFSDALSAKQVAYYVRSDFASVAVVPVSVDEKQRAMDGAHNPKALGAPRENARPAEEFKLLDADAADAAAPRIPIEDRPAAAAPAAPVPADATAVAPAKRGRSRTRPAVRKPGSGEDGLEQTLEILGASDLEIDKGRGELLNDSGVRHLSVKIDKRTSTFSKLLDRLSDRIGSR